MRENKEEMQVAALKNGTVIDHIPSDKLFTVVSLLGLKHLTNNITIGNNLDSKLLGKKIIRDYEVVEKRQLQLPDELIGIVKCSNQKCITNNEPMPTRFHVIDKDNCVIKCHYCDKEQHRDEIHLV